MESKAWRRKGPSLREWKSFREGVCLTSRLHTTEADAFAITSAGGEVKSRSFPGNRWAVLPGVERLVSGPSSLSTGGRAPFTGNRDLPAAGRSGGNCPLAWGPTDSCAEPILGSGRQWGGLFPSRPLQWPQSPIQPALSQYGSVKGAVATLPRWPFRGKLQLQRLSDRKSVV